MKSEPRNLVSGISGRWLMTTGAVLTINSGEWSHPSKGAADIMTTGYDQLTVRYPQDVHVKCDYRFILLNEGKTLELVSANHLQPDGFCPSGRLTALR
jgi:hypothetical protein